MRISFIAAALAAGATFTAFAQEGSKPAPVITIYREGIKEGREAAHEKLEADYAAAFPEGEAGQVHLDCHDERRVV
jgi:hypothetical protein